MLPAVLAGLRPARRLRAPRVPRARGELRGRTRAVPDSLTGTAAPSSNLRLSSTLRQRTIAVAAAPQFSRPFSGSAAGEAISSGSSTLNFTSVFPPFAEVRPADVVPGMKELMKDATGQLEELERDIERRLDTSGGEVTYEIVARGLEAMQDKVERAWGTVRHLQSVCDEEELRLAVEEVMPEYVSFGLRVAQSQPLYKAWKHVKDHHSQNLSSSQLRVVEKEVLGATLSGVALQGKEKERFNEIEARLEKLATDFSNNVLDTTKAFSVRLTEKPAGVPQSVLSLASQTARSRGDADSTADEGPWVFTLDLPSYLPIMQFAEDRELRCKMYEAYLTRASEFSPAAEGKDCMPDNAPLAAEILALRREKAKLLGYDSYAELSMAAKMATLPQALKFIEDLRSASLKAGNQELEDLQKFANERGFRGQLMHWDIGFYAERQKEHLFGFSEEELKPFFPLPNVQKGLFGLAKRLFDVDIRQIDPKEKGVSVWHDDVQLFELSRDGRASAYFYLDPYSRPGTKRGGAWMDEVAGRTENRALACSPGGIRPAVAHMVCNQSQPIDDKPSLMTFDEVETLFHEFGHALQHMLTQESEGFVAGIRGVEWDAVEQPSQFMENWCYLDLGMAVHYETGEAIPKELFDKVRGARTYRAASQMLRQLHFALVDLKLHSEYDPSAAGRSIFDVDRDVSELTDVMPQHPSDRFLCSFSHIFAGGYSAGYYSYKWAEVLSADCFGAFEEAGLQDDFAVQTMGRRFRDTILGLGGGVEPGEVFRRFRGRDPTVDALLRHNGLAA